MEPLLLAAATAAAIIGCALLALSQKRHWRATCAAVRTPERSRRVRLLGTASTMASLVFCLLGNGLSFAVLLWPLLLALASILVGLSLSIAPGILRPLAALVVRDRT